MLYILKFTVLDSTKAAHHEKYKLTHVKHISKASFERAMNHNQLIGITSSSNHHCGFSIKDIWNISQLGKVCLIFTNDTV